MCESISTFYVHAENCSHVYHYLLRMLKFIHAISEELKKKKKKTGFRLKVHCFKKVFKHCSDYNHLR